MINQTKLIIVIFIIFTIVSCGQTVKNSFNFDETVTFRDISNITAEEVAAIEALKGKYEYLSFGIPRSTEAFLYDDGSIGGFADLLCDFMTQIFQIQFIPVMINSHVVQEKLESGEIHFSAFITPNHELAEKFFLSNTIFERQLVRVRLAGSPLPHQIFPGRKIRYATPDNTAVARAITAVANPDTYEIVLSDGFSAAYKYLKSGVVDFYIDSSIIDLDLNFYHDVIVENYFPPVSNPFSLATTIAELRPIITIMEKLLLQRGKEYLDDLYKIGYNDYRVNKFHNMLTDEEKEYICDNPLITIAGYTANYPFSYYDTRQKKWSGLYFNILQEVKKLTGFNFQVGHEANTVFSEVYQKLVEGELAIIPELVPSAEREKHLIWSNKLILNDHFALISKNLYPNLSINAIHNVTVGLAKNTLHAETFRRWFPTHELIKEYDSIELAFEGLKRNEVDVVMSTQRRLRYLTNYQKNIGYKTNVIFPDVIETRLVFNKDETVLISIFEKAFKLIDFDLLITQWTANTPDQSQRIQNTRTRYFLLFYLILTVVFVSLLSILLKNKYMSKEISIHEDLFSVVSKVSSILLNPNLESSNANLVSSMEIIGNTLNIHRVCIWKNYRLHGHLHCTLLLEWVSPSRPKVTEFFLTDLSYDETISEWEEILSNDRCINKKTCETNVIERIQLNAQHIKSLFVAPVFINNEFWGFVGFDDCFKERVFSKNEEIILRTTSRMIANTFVRNFTTGYLVDTKQQLEKALVATREANKIKTASQKALETILDNLEAFVYTSVPNTGRFIFVNKYMREKLNLGTGDITNLYCYKVLRDLDKICDFCPGVILNESPNQQVIWEDFLPKVGMRLRHQDVYITWQNGELVHLHYAVDISALHKAKLEAEESNRYKTSFLATMSHEIRTPINAIMGISELQMQSENLTEEINYAFDKIYESGSLLLNIVNDILDLSKIEAGKLELVPVKYDLPSLIVDTAHLNLFRIDNKSIVFKVVVDENTPRDLWGEELRIKQILNNILSNAFKYTNEGNVELNVSSRYRENEKEVILIFDIKDSGQGMTQDQLTMMFEEYSRFNLEANRTTVGTGLGMSITKKLVAMLNGTIFVESEPGKGSTFTVHIPQNRTSASVCGPELTEKLKDICSLKTVASKKVHIIKEYMPHGKVLVVDDIELNIFVAKGMLMAYGLHIDTSTSGFDTIDKVKNGNVYDIIFMDHMMPKMDGMETTKKLREMNYKQPIVALTANAIIGQSEMFLQNGFNDYISKPIDSRELNSILNHFIKYKDMNKTKEGDFITRRLKPKNLELSIEQTEMNQFIKDIEKIIGKLRLTEEKFPLAEKEDFMEYITLIQEIKKAMASVDETDIFSIATQLEGAAKAEDMSTITLQTKPLHSKISLLLKSLHEDANEN